MLHKYFTVGLHGKTNPPLFATSSLGSLDGGRGKEKYYLQGISRDRTGDKAKMHDRDWPDLWRETEGDPNRVPKFTPGKELPSTLPSLRHP